LDELGISKAQNQDPWQIGHGHPSKNLGKVTATGQVGHNVSGGVQPSLPHSPHCP
jgi:hypothetical protein